tara:strand:+ start:560 stop:1036 length:477 start_codon:yes stop_codon:yes gene_type:complete
MKKDFKVHHLNYQEEDSQDHLIAIHSNIEAFQIAYFLNKYTNSTFRREEDIDLNVKEAFFYLFKWENSLIDIKTILFSNKYKHNSKHSKLNKNLLFNVPLRNEVYLFSEFKNIDFFIKSNHLETIQLLIKTLNSWEALTMVYKVPSRKIKSQMNSIFN